MKLKKHFAIAVLILTGLLNSCQKENPEIPDHRQASTGFNANKNTTLPAPGFNNIKVPPVWNTANSVGPDRMEKDTSNHLLLF